jgi:predicted dehydrogenase
LVAGVAGAGVFGGYHAAKYAALAGVELAAIFDIDMERAGALARRVGARAYRDFDAFLDHVDILTVATPASAHFAAARRALERGKHVLVEKPIALSLAEADRLIATAALGGRVLQVGHQERFVFEALGVLSRGKRPLSVCCVRANPPTGRGDDVSVAFDLLIHDIDLVRRLGFGAPASISATGDADALEAEIVCEGGAVVVMEASRLAPQRDRRMRLVYDDGIIEIDFVRRRVENTTPAPLAAGFEDGDMLPALADPLGFGVSCFVSAVRAAAPPPVTGEEARAALEWALLIEAALGEQASVRARSAVGGAPAKQRVRA